MSNKNPKKHQDINNEASLLVKEFNGLNIQVYGTYEQPLFKAKDIGELLDIKNIKDTIKNFNSKQKLGVVLTDPHGRLQETNMLTEQGLYKVLMRSRKQIAEQFQDWVCEVVEEIRKKGKYDLEEHLQLKEKEYNQLLHEKELELIKYKEKVYEEIEKTGHIYVIKTDGGTKVGKTKDAVTKRIKGLQTGNRNDIEVLLDFKTSNADLLERTVHYILDRYRCNSNREFFDCDIEYIKTIVETIGKVIDTLKSCYQNITKDQILDKLSENGININLDSCVSESTYVNEDVSVNVSVSEESELYNWLNNNIELDKNGILRLKKMCELYMDMNTVHPKLSNKIRLEIEKWIKKKYKNINFQYKDSYFNGERYRGWVGLKLK
jgi:prophage antirepressor-like protein